MHQDAVKRLFIILACVTLLLILCRRYVIDAGDPYHCAALLNEGQWLDKPAHRPARRAFQKWQPPGCLLHEYDSTDISACAGGRQMIFIGDSNIRQLFWAVARKVNHDQAVEMGAVATRHGDIQYQENGVDLRFVWDPFLNGSILENELEIYSENLDSGIAGRRVQKEGQKEQDAVMLVLGGGLWHARQFETGQAVRHFQNAVNHIIPYTMRDNGGAWHNTDPFVGWEGVGDQVFFVPVEEPVYERLSPARQKTINPDEVDQMNEYLRTLAPSQGLTIPWVNQVMTGKMKYAYEQSGFHVVESIANRRADVILNWRCNAKVDNVIGSPYERTCCSKYTSGNWSQWVLLAISLVALPLALLVLPRTNKLEVSTDLRSLLCSLATIGIAVAYAFVADRSQLFIKVQKVYYRSDFATLVAFAFAFGLLTIRKTTGARRRRSSTKDAFVIPASTFLPREQTDEWKGWMQVLVLSYYWTAAESEFTLYVVLRLITASYLFITAYGHTMHIYRQQDFTLRRVAAVLIRLNLLPVMLSYQMYNRYLVYQFPPLSTFWCLVIFATLRFGAELNKKPGFLLAKLMLSAILVSLSHGQARSVDAASDVLRSIFSVDWHAGDWQSAVMLDVYIPYVGMLVALLHIWYQDAASSSSPKGLDRDARALSRSLSPVLVQQFRPWVVALSIVVIPIVTIAVSGVSDQAGFDSQSALLSPLPVLSYVVLRNAHPLLREHYSVAFAWLGSCSLETWTLSFHVLRAADGRGVLGTGWFSPGNGKLLSDRWKDAILIGPLLLWTAWCVSRATRRLAAWFGDAHGLGKRCAALLIALWALNLATG